MRMHLRRLAHVNFSIDDVAAAQAFYAGVLGLEPAPRPTDAGRPGGWFRLGPVEIHLSVDEHNDAARSKRHVAFEVEDLAGWRAHLAAAGVAIDEGRPMPGVRRLFVRDPSGNRLELFEPIA